MPRPQFSLKTLLWLMALIVAFCAGMALMRAIDDKRYGEGEVIHLP